MRRYETIFIVDADLSDESRNQAFGKTKDLIDGYKGVLVNFDEWGNRKLAYEIKKKPRGYYVYMDYCGTAELVNELERTFRLDDRFMKYMTVLLDSSVDLEKVMAEKEEKEKAETATESEAEETEKTTEAPAEEPISDKEEK